MAIAEIERPDHWRHSAHWQPISATFVGFLLQPKVVKINLWLAACMVRRQQGASLKVLELRAMNRYAGVPQLHD